MREDLESPLSLACLSPPPARWILEQPRAACVAWYSTHGSRGPHGRDVAISEDVLVLRIVGLLIDLQHIFHLGDIVFIEIGHYTFFPATVSDRGSAGESEWFPFLLGESACV